MPVDGFGIVKNCSYRVTASALVLALTHYIGPEPNLFLMLSLTLMLMLSVNGTIKINVSTRVNADAWCE